jgi:DNA (cytosine-5)-methyltransferase 1
VSATESSPLTSCADAPGVLDGGTFLPRALDLFCGAGGVSVGLQRAGFEVTGVDIKEQPNYRGGAFVLGDALSCPLDGFDFVWASPPCQAHTAMSNRWRGRGGVADEHTSLIAATRDRLLAWGGLYVIENVPGARRHMVNPGTMSGSTFGLGVHRPRLFESNLPIQWPPRQAPPRGTIGVYGKAHDGRLLWRRKDGSEQRAARSLEQAAEAMGGVHWMTWRELAESIPPAYAQFIGEQAIALLRQGKAV